MRISRALLLIVVLLVPPGVAAVVEKSHRYPRRFAEVLQGNMYRGGFPTGDQICSLRSEKRIKTVVSLTDLKDEPKYIEEVEAVQAAGLRLLRFPMPGDGRGEFDDLDRAADAVGDQANWPVFFHCDAGKQRSNAVLAAYRLRKCGWTIDQTLRELENEYDLDRKENNALVDHLRAYAKRLGRSPGAGEQPPKGTSGD
jgi:protein tyrosine/serine phosphatase